MTKVRESGDPQTGSVLFYGVVGVLVTAVIIIALWAVYERTTDTEAQSKVFAQNWQELARLRSEHETELQSYRWVSQKDGVVGIPIDRAMELVIRDLNKGESK